MQAPASRFRYGECRGHCTIKPSLHYPTADDMVNSVAWRRRISEHFSRNALHHLENCVRLSESRQLGVWRLIYCFMAIIMCIGELNWTEGFFILVVCVNAENADNIHVNTPNAVILVRPINQVQFGRWHKAQTRTLELDAVRTVC